MYSFLTKIKEKLGGNYDYVIARVLSLPVLVAILSLLSHLPSGKSNTLIYSVMLVGALVNGTAGQSIFQFGLSNKKSFLLFNLNFTIIEFLLIALVGLFNGLYLLADKYAAIVVLTYVFFRVMTMILMNHLYKSKHYIQSVNFIFSKLIDLFLIYYVSINASQINSFSQDKSINFYVTLLIFLLVIALIFAYLNYRKLVTNMAVRLPVSLLYMGFSFLFFNFAADLVKTNSSYLLRLKGLFDALASIVSVTSLKQSILKKPSITKFNMLILFNIFASFVIVLNVVWGMVFFALAAVFSAKIYSRTVVVHGVFWHSFAWSLSLSIAIMLMLFDSKFSTLAYAICETLPLVVIHLKDSRLQHYG